MYLHFCLGQCPPLKKATSDAAMHVVDRKSAANATNEEAATFHLKKNRFVLASSDVVGTLMNPGSLNTMNAERCYDSGAIGVPEAVMCSQS